MVVITIYALVAFWRRVTRGHIRRKVFSRSHRWGMFRRGAVFVLDRWLWSLFESADNCHRAREICQFPSKMHWLPVRLTFFRRQPEGGGQRKQKKSVLYKDAMPSAGDCRSLSSTVLFPIFESRSFHKPFSQNLNLSTDFFSLTEASRNGRK